MSEITNPLHSDIGRRVKFNYYDNHNYSLNEEPSVWKTCWGFVIDAKGYEGRYPEHSCDFEIIVYVIEGDDNKEYQIVEDEVEMMGWFKGR